MSKAIRDKDLQSVQEVRRLCEAAAEAQKSLARLSQEQTDRIVAAMAEASRRESQRLADLAVQETTYGNPHDKNLKNLFSAEMVYGYIKTLKTAGILREDPQNKVIEIGEPMGVVAAIIPTTNPTSTTIYKGLIALKARCAVVFSPHPSAVRCISETASVLAEAALGAGAPAGSIGCMTISTMEGTQELMRHPAVAVVLATGGAGLVRAAYSSGKPAYGVGPGNVPAFVERTADVPKAVRDIVAGKCFDNGTLCSAEQAVVVDEPVDPQVRDELKKNGAHFLTPEEVNQVAQVVVTPGYLVNPKIVGQTAPAIAQLAGVRVPPATRVLIGELEGVGKKYPLSIEKLSPVLAYYRVRDWKHGLDVCTQLLRFGGLGHTIVLHSRDDEVIRQMAMELPAFRIVVNSLASIGAVGYTTGIVPSMTLGCGGAGGNITSDNISPLHLINVKRVAYETRP
ncbi:MAG: aldehyde dehydrogenase family protein [Acidobacteria bacterium]|nr:aldehyde dehydrogenase family protein [Acidobacteriota bacterium]